jgi:hypothetical protein
MSFAGVREEGVAVAVVAPAPSDSCRLLFRPRFFLLECRLRRRAPEPRGDVRDVSVVHGDEGRRPRVERAVGHEDLRSDRSCPCLDVSYPVLLCPILLRFILSLLEAERANACGGLF